MIITQDDLRFMQMAIQQARQCTNARARDPLVGAVLARKSELIETAYRAELDPEKKSQHAEYTLLIRKLENAHIPEDATLYVTLEPCAERSPEKTECAEWVIKSGVKRVFVGMIDPDPTVMCRGIEALRRHGISVDLFPDPLRQQIEEMNAEFLRVYRPARPTDIFDEYRRGTSIDDKVKELRDRQERDGGTKIANHCRQRLYKYGGIQALAVRLFGAGSESYRSTDVDIAFDETPYHLPAELEARQTELVYELTYDAVRNNASFYNGPCVRLLNYRFTSTDEEADTERKRLSLTLGRVGWYDYSMANNWFSPLLRVIASTQRLADIRNYVDLDAVLRNGDLRKVRLSNIVCTATTVLTNDGYLFCSRRSSRVSTSPDRLTSAIAENLHQIKDRFGAVQTRGELEMPFRTVVRGLGEELSASLNPLATGGSLRLLGISFDLESFHPDLLFLLPLPIGCTALLEMVQEKPGQDFHEGQLLWAPVDPENPQLMELLEEPDWIPSGQASLIRAAEFVASLAAESGLSSREAAWALCHDQSAP